MGKSLITILILTLSIFFEATAQTEPIRFSSIFQQVGDYDVLRFDEVYYGDSCFIVMATVSKPHGVLASDIEYKGVFRIDYSGDIINYHVIEENTTNYKYTYWDGHVYVLESSPILEDTTRNVMLYALDEDFEEVWRKEYTGFSYSKMIHALKFKEGLGFLGVLRETVGPSFAGYKYSFIQFDQEGELVSDDVVFDSVRYLIKHIEWEEDGGFLLTGFEFWNPENIQKGLVIKLRSDLTVDNQYLLSEGNSMFSQSVRLPDESVLSVGNTSYHNPYSSGIMYWVDDEMAADFELIADEYSYSGLYSSILHSNGNIYNTGYLNLNPVDQNYIHQLYVINQERAFQFSRHVNHGDMTSNGSIQDIKELPDGSIVMAGCLLKHRSLSEFGGYSAAWIIVTDENGCMSEDCSYPQHPLSNESSGAPVIDFSVFPNPAEDGYFSIYSERMVFPAAIAVYNIMGQEILYQEWISYHPEMNIDLSIYAAGTYFVVVQNKEGAGVKKILVK